jgi:hypothetical protein
MGYFNTALGKELNHERGNYYSKYRFTPDKTKHCLRPARAGLKGRDGRYYPFFLKLPGLGKWGCGCRGFDGCRYPEGDNETEASAPIINNNQRVWAVYKDIELDSDIFADIGRDFSGAGQVSCGRVGSAKTLFFKQREAVDFALNWLNQMPEEP